MVTSDNAALGPLTCKFHHKACASEVLSGLEVMLMEWQADYPEGNPFTIRHCNREFPYLKFEIIPVEEGSDGVLQPAA